MTASALLPVIAAFIIAWRGTAAALRIALRKNILDVPNQRSSHSAPVPRGGGIAIVVSAIACVVAAAGFGLIDPRVVAAFVPGGVAIAAAGAMDDLRPLSARMRLSVHFAAATFAVWCLGGLPALHYGPGVLTLGLPGSILAIVTIVWMTNLYNFMDGIDGIAAGHGLVAATAGALILCVAGAYDIALVAAILGAALLGFLLWNWQPASIFMGDVGSGFTGYVFGVLTIATERNGAVPGLLWFVLLGVFIFDATVTLVRRGLRGEKVYAAHRSHAYQRLVASGLTHARVSALTMALAAALALLAALDFWKTRNVLLPVTMGAFLVAVAYGLIEKKMPMSPPVGDE